MRTIGRPEDAEDALQDGLLLALRNLRRFEKRARFSTWLTRIVINAALVQRRKSKRERARLTRSGQSSTGELLLIDRVRANSFNPEQTYGRAEQF